MAADPSLQMWLTFGVIGAALVLYMQERVALELTSLGVVCALIVLFQILPLPGPNGTNSLGPERLLAGFASPALVTVLALLVIGQGLVRTGLLDAAAGLVLRLSRGGGLATMLLVLVAVAAVSAFLNNIPVVVIFVPIMQAVSEHLGRPAGKVMIPLSFAAILGGMTTLIGSSTNLLVSNALVEAGEAPFGFFDFSVPGLVLATAGLAYVLFVAPYLLPARSPAGDEAPASGRQFVAQLEVGAESELLGERALAGHLPGLPGMTLLMLQRAGTTLLPPFEDTELGAGDVLVVAATRKVLTEALTREAAALQPDLRRGRRAEAEAAAPWRQGEQMLAEVMVTPNSRLNGQNLEQIGFRYLHRCVVLGIQRRSRMIRMRMTEIALRAGDVLLVLGQPDDVRRLRLSPAVLLMEWSAADLPARQHVRRAGLVFLGTIGLAASGLLSIVAAALIGAVAMIATGALSVSQAVQALDRKVAITIATALALGVVLQGTGGANFLAEALLELMAGAGPAAVLSAFFLLVAMLSNILSTKATAVLFTPIAVGIAHGLNSDPTAFAVAVVFAANCSFASPLGYQTNLLVMSPGGYRFRDFVRVGLPLIAVMWLVFTFVAPWYFDLS